MGKKSSETQVDGHTRSFDNTSMNERRLSVTSGTAEKPSILALLPPPPDGGTQAWLQVVAAFLCTFNSGGIPNAFGVYQEYYQEHILQSKSTFQISWIGTLCGALLFLGTNIFGGFIDLGYIKPLALFACLMQFTALMLLSWSTTYAEIILTQGVFSGLIFGLIFLTSIACVAPYFSTKRPLAIGLGAAGSSVGGALYASIARKLISEVGFGWSTRIIAFIGLFTTAVMFLCIKRRLPPTRRKSFIAVECFREPVFMLYSLGLLCEYIGMYTFYYHFQSFAVSLDRDEISYKYLTAIINAGSLLGRTLPAYAANYTGPLNTMIPCELVGIIVLFCWMKVHTKAGVIATAVIFGFLSGPLIGLPGAVVSYLTEDFNRLGIRLGFAFLFCTAGFIVGPPLAGIIQEKYGWFYLQLYAALSWVLCIAFHITARMIQSRGKLRYKM